MIVQLRRLIVTSPSNVAVSQDISTSPEAGIHFNKKSPGSLAGLGSLATAANPELDKLKSEGGLAVADSLGPARLYSEPAMGYGKGVAGVGDMYGAGDYSRLLSHAHHPAQPDYSKLLGGHMGAGQGLYHSFMQNSYMTSQLNMASHPHQAASLPNLPSSY